MEPKWEESLDLVTRKDFFEEKQLVTLRAQHQMAGCAQHENLQRLMPRTDVHWTLRDRRARRLQMASAPTGQERFEEEEETFSIQESDSDEIDPEQTPKTVSKTSKHKTHEKTTKAQGTPPPWPMA
ncbi:hypothetical protein NDU88_000422 [Pleurodeles waltl]|uniref:Uncharacterized protein n=1 Tax=Pleurodeles waltl TaxID=8319 RepID=A0AAV7LY36_PLEWA|nr:hypothetical protein NDU88_000422 [Pleurodeles waltl]